MRGCGITPFFCVDKFYIHVDLFYNLSCSGQKICQQQEASVKSLYISQINKRNVCKIVE